MDNPNPLLSICIPTYNRASFLRECLDSILISAHGYEDQVEIVISDNASTDETQSLVAHIQQEHPQLRYDRQPENIGGENNFYAAAQMASSEYLWLFGDDDTMLPHAIPIIVRYLRQPYDLIVTNFSIWTNDLSAIKLKNMMPLRRDVVFDDRNQLLAALGAQLSYLSAVVLRRKLFLTPPRANYDAFAEHGLSFLYVAYAGLAPNCQALYLHEPLICNRDNPRALTPELWVKYFITGTQKLFPELEKLGYTHAAVEAAQDRLLHDYALRTILGRARDEDNALSLIGLMIPQFKRHPFFWLVCVPAALIPSPLLRLATRVVRWRRSTSASSTTNLFARPNSK